MKFYTMLFFICFFIMSQKTQAFNSYPQFKNLPFSLNFDFKYFKTDSNFNADGQKDNLLPGYNFTNLNLNSNLRWQLNSNWAAVGGFNTSSSESNDYAFSRKNSLINKINFGAEYLFINDLWIRWIARLNYIHAVEKIDMASDVVLTSNADNEFNPEILVNIDFEDGIYSFARIGFISRSNGLSSLATYGLGSEIRFSEFGIGASVLGELTIKNDDYSQRSSFRDNYNLKVNAGSKMFNSINPNSNVLEFNFNFLMSQKALLKFYVGSPLIGSNTAAGYYAGLNFNYFFGSVSKKSNLISPSNTNIIRPSRNYDPDNFIFKEKTDDGVNQDYFKPSVGTDADPVILNKPSTGNQQIKIKLRKKKNTK